MSIITRSGFFAAPRYGVRIRPRAVPRCGRIYRPTHNVSRVFGVNYFFRLATIIFPVVSRRLLPEGTDLGRVSFLSF